MTIIRQCSCGKPHLKIPENAKFHDSDDSFAGYYFNCSCGSTIFVPKEKVK